MVGFPNVGKSTLVNRLTGTRQAVVHETPGVTRDRKEVVCEWNGKRFLLVDTGGVDIADPSPITRSIADQARAAIAEADLVLFVVDARAGITPGDEELAAILRTSHKPVLLLANKIDDPSQDALAFEFHRLGLGDPLPISAVHGLGTGDLLDVVVSRLPGGGREEVGEDAIRVAILGRPNVGQVEPAERDPRPGARDRLRDARDDARRDRHRLPPRRADVRARRHRRPASTSAGSGRGSSTTRSCGRCRRPSARTSPWSCSTSRRASSTRIWPSPTWPAGRTTPTLVVLNKWDIGTVGIEDVRPRLEARLRQRPPIVAASAKTGRGIGRMLDRIEELFDRSSSRIPTAELNKFLGELKEARQPPSRRRQAPQHAVRHADPDPPATLSRGRQ